MESKKFHIKHKFRTFVILLWILWILTALLLCIFSGSKLAFTWIFSGLMVFIVMVLSGCYSGFWYFTKGKYYRNKEEEIIPAQIEYDDF